MGIVIGAFLGLIIGSAVGTYSTAGSEWSFGYGLLGGLIGVIVGGIVGGMVHVAAANSAEKERRARAELQQAEHDRRRQREEREAERRNAALSIVHGANLAVEAYEAMPRALEAVESEIAAAQHYRSDGAFSPFWSAIEHAYAGLAEYRQAADVITRSAALHAEWVDRLTRAGGRAEDLGQFPVELDKGSVQSRVEEPLRALASLVYEAQKEPVFAQIWEQRRTTAAVVTGFANLEEAVRRMGSAVTSSAMALNETLTKMNLQVAQTIERATDAVSAASAQEIGEMRALAARSHAIYQETFRIGHGRYPIH